MSYPYKEQDMIFIFLIFKEACCSKTLFYYPYVLQLDK